MQLSHNILSSAPVMVTANASEEAHIEAEARRYAAVTIEAQELAEYMRRKFYARIKGSDEAGRILLLCGITDMSYLGKLVEVQVDWELSKLVESDKPLFKVWVKKKGENRGSYALVFEDEFPKLFTQMGPILNMFNIWKYSVGKKKGRPNLRYV